MDYGKKISVEGKSKKVVAMINGGASWEEVAEAFSHSERYVRQLAKSRYKTKAGYQRLLKKARLNKKVKQKNKSSQPEKTKEKIREVIVTETGYLLSTEGEILVKKSSDVIICIPKFCLTEMARLGREDERAKKILNLCRKNQKLKVIDIRGREQIFIEPTNEIRNRTKGIVAVCCYIWSEKNAKVRLLTNSREVQELIEKQGMDIEVEKV